MARTASFVIVSMVVALSGCASFGSFGGSGLTPGAADPAVAYPPATTVAIEYHAHSEKISVEDLPLEPGMAVGDALKKARVNKKFRRAFIDLQRTPKGGMPHKMPIDYKAGQVGHTTNYDLHPNDRIIVTEDGSTILDDMMGKFIPGAKKSGRR